MVAEDVDRLERQMLLRGEQAKWALLSVSNNCLYDEGIAKLVRVLRKTTAPLETLDLSHTGMTCVGAKLVATLLAPAPPPAAASAEAAPAEEAAGRLPLKRLLLYGNGIGADGFAALGAALRQPGCGLDELVVSTHLKEPKPASRKRGGADGAELTRLVVSEIAEMHELAGETYGSAELLVLSQLLVGTSTLTAIHLSAPDVGDAAAAALGELLGHGLLPLRALRCEGGRISAEGGAALCDGARRGGCPLQELCLIDQPLTASAAAVRLQVADAAVETELRRQDESRTRTTPAAAEWARVQLQLRASLAWRRARALPPTTLSRDELESVLALPAELREDRWLALGGIYGADATPSPEAAAAAAADGRLPLPLPDDAFYEPPDEMRLPSVAQLCALRDDDQLRQLWQMLIAPPAVPQADGGYCADAVRAACALLSDPSSQLHTLALCGINLCGGSSGGHEGGWGGSGGGYTAEGVEAVCAALGASCVALRSLRLERSGMREAEAAALAAALLGAARRGLVLRSLVLDGPPLVMPPLLGAAPPPLGTRVECAWRPMTPAEVCLASALLGRNERVQLVRLGGAACGAAAAHVSEAIGRGTMPLQQLHLPNNALTPELCVQLVRALRRGSPHLELLDLSENPICGIAVETEGVADAFSPSAIAALCSWLDGRPDDSADVDADTDDATPCNLRVLRLRDVALCGQAADGSGAFRPQALSLLTALIGGGKCPLRELELAGCRLRRGHEATRALGRALASNGELRRLRVDRAHIEVGRVLRGDALDLAGRDFSEVDAALIAPLLLHNRSITRIDLSGDAHATAAVRALADAFAAAGLRPHELSASGRLLGLEGTAALLEPLRSSPLECLDLGHCDLCGITAQSSGLAQFSTYVLRIICGLVAPPPGGGDGGSGHGDGIDGGGDAGGLVRLHVPGNQLLGDEHYTSEGIALLTAALGSPACRLEELRLGLASPLPGPLLEDDALALADAAEQCASLRVLSLVAVDLPMAQLSAASTALELHGAGLCPSDVTVVTRLLRRCTRLASLDLAHNSLGGGGGVEALADALRAAAPPLTELCLASCALCVPGTLALLRTLRDTAPPLRTLDLSANAAALAAGVGLPSSSSSSLSMGGESPLRLLCEETMRVLPLRHLGLAANQLGSGDDDGADDAEHAAGCTLLATALAAPSCQLAVLDVGNNGFTRADAVALTAACSAGCALAWGDLDVEVFVRGTALRRLAERRAGARNALRAAVEGSPARAA